MCSLASRVYNKKDKGPGVPSRSSSRSPLVAQWVKDPVWSLLEPRSLPWLRFNPRSGKFYLQQKKKKKKERKKRKERKKKSKNSPR